MAAYSLSLAAVAAAALLRLALDPWLGSQLPLATFLLPVLLLSWYGGRGPALVALLLGAICAGYLFIEPRHTFRIADSAYRFALLLYCVVGWLILLVIETLRIASARAAAQSELLRVTLGSIADGVITTDPSERITGLNPTAESLTGWSARDAVGQSLAAVFRVHEESSGRAREALGAPASGNQESAEVRTATLSARDGVQRVIEMSTAPLRRVDLPIMGTVLVFRDLTARRQQEREFQVLAESMSQLAWMATPEGELIWYNQRWYEYTGTNFEQMQGWGWQAVHDPAQLPRVIEAWRHCLATGEPLDTVFPLRSRDGVFHPFITRAVPLKDANGKVTRWFGTNTDISEQKRIEAELRQAEERLLEQDRRKDQFLATLAHELRNPLAPIRAAAKILGSSALDATQLQWVREVVQRQAKHMAWLLDDLLDVARITQGKLELKRERVLLTSVVETAVEATRPLFESKHHQLRVSLPAVEPLLNADPVRLSQVLSNLLTNSAKYCDAGGHIELSGVMEEGGLYLTVTDDGIGIPRSALERIFEMFSQVEEGASHSDGGLGIGLALVKGLVELHGGTVQAHSEGSGKGSRFVVRLPASCVETVAGVVGEAGLPRLSAGRRLLVVDDNKDAADTLAMMLQLAGHEVRVAHGGSAALAVAHSFRPDVAILDIGMPDMNGYELATALRGQSWAAGMYLIALTGWGQEGDRQRAREAGFDQHMTKPLDPEALDSFLANMDVRYLQV